MGLELFGISNLASAGAKFNGSLSDNADVLFACREFFTIIGTKKFPTEEGAA